MNTFSEQAARLHCAFENLGKDVKLRIDSFKDDVALKCRCLQSAVSGIKRQIEIHGAAATESIERNQALLFAVSAVYIVGPVRKLFDFS